MNKRFFLFWGVLVAMVVAVTGGYFVWTKYFKYDLEKVYQEEERKYVEAMTADTYGGKTPQETLDMFVDALRKEDIELASKYFLLDENLSREKWEDYLTEVRNRGLLNKMADDIQNRTQSVNGDNETDYGFEILNREGLVAVLIDMYLNKYSGAWKIESL